MMGWGELIEGGNGRIGRVDGVKGVLWVNVIY